MNIYIESIFIINFLLDFMILYGTKRILNKESSWKCFLLSSFIGSTTTFLVYFKISTFLLFLIKIFLSMFMIFVCFGKKDFIKTFGYFYCISILLGGSMYLFNIHKLSNKRILILLLCPILIYFFVSEYKKYKIYQKEVYDVEIYISKRKYLLKGFLDTGNHLKSPISQKGIILVNLDIPRTKSYYIPYKALNVEGVIECMKPDKLIINEKEIHSCLIGFSNQPLQIDGCNCILPNSLREEL